MAVQHDIQMEENMAARHVAAFFEKFEHDRYECQELLQYTVANLHMPIEDFKVPIDPPLGVISNISPISEFRVMLLLPQEEGIEAIDMREVHQIVKELTNGIFVFNQTPTISLEPNFDLSSSCQMPPAYHDTRIGQLLINVDYMLKAVWHGAYFVREQRIKFSERWRNCLDVNSSGKSETRKDVFNEFVNAGLIDLTFDADYTNSYESVSQDREAYFMDERRFFMTHVDNVALRIIFHQKSIQQFRNLFVVDPDWDITSVIHIVDEAFDVDSYERLALCLGRHRTTVLQHLCNKAEVRRQVFMLKFVSFLVPFLVAMKKKMKVPDIIRMFPNMTADETKTERELPPLMIGPDYKCKHFQPSTSYVHLHGGILFDLETTNPVAPPQSIIDAFNDVKEETSNYINKFIDNPAPYQESYPAPVKEIDGQKYFLLALDFDTYYPQPPQRPKWIGSMVDEIAKLRHKRLPLQDIQIHEQFKKYAGYMRAIKYRNIQHGLRMAAQRGLVAIFAALSHKSPSSRLGKHDELGMSMIHYAAMYNRPEILATLVLQSMDINLRKISTAFAQEAGTSADDEMEFEGPTPLHLAARCGALDVVSCLLACGASMLLVDKEGWAPIHHASFYNHPRVVFLMVCKNAAMLELQTKNEQKSTPLLLAASSGAVCVVKSLLDLGAYVLRHDENGNNAVHLAALRFHTNVLEFFIEWKRGEVDIWQILTGMLRHENLDRKLAAAKCLQSLTSKEPGYYLKILNAGGVSVLADLLKVENTSLHLVTTHVLCNISCYPPVCEALTKANATPTLVHLLHSPNIDVQSQLAIILSDLGQIPGNQKAIAAEGAIPSLIKMLDYSYEGILVNAVNAIRVLCDRNVANQMEAGKGGAIPPLVEFLSVSSVLCEIIPDERLIVVDVLQAGAAAAIAALAINNKENQDAVVKEGARDDGAVKCLVRLIKGHNINVQIKAALAVQALTNQNEASQAIFLKFDTPKALIRLLKMFSLEVKEQAAVSLWSLAGQTNTRQRFIAEIIGTAMLIEMLLRDSEKLQYVGCMALMALGKEDTERQNAIVEFGAIPPLVRLLRLSKTTPLVMITCIRAIATLSLGLAYRNNKLSQDRMAEENAIGLLVQLLADPPSEEIQVEVAYSLACLVLGNSVNQERLSMEPAFSFDLLLQLLSSPNEDIRLRAGYALAIFGFNNTAQQLAIREAGGLPLECLEEFLQSGNEFQRATAAFQVVVLARVIVDSDPVVLTAHSITVLIEILNSKNEDAVIVAASFISSLCHTRAGIPDAMVTIGAIQLLTNHLFSANEQVRFSCAVALGYLTYNRTASRYLLSVCRNRPGLYDRLMASIGKNPKINSNFVEDFQRARIIGLPCLSLEIYGGRTKHGKRPTTSLIGRPSSSAPPSENGFIFNRLSRSSSAKFTQRPKSTGAVVHLKRPLPTPVSVDILRLRKSSSALTREATPVSDDSKAFKTRLSAWESP